MNNMNRSGSSNQAKNQKGNFFSKLFSLGDSRSEKKNGSLKFDEESRLAVSENKNPLQKPKTRITKKNKKRKRKENILGDQEVEEEVAQLCKLCKREQPLYFY